MGILKQIKVDIAGIDCSVKRLRQFGLLMAVIFVLLLFVFDSIFMSLGWIVVGLVLLVALWKPPWFRVLYLVWMGFGTVVGFFVSRVILALVYVCVIVPIGLAMQIFKGRRFKTDRTSNSYWRTAESDYNDPNSLERQD